MNSSWFNETNVWVGEKKRVSVVSGWAQAPFWCVAAAGNSGADEVLPGVELGVAVGGGVGFGLSSGRDCVEVFAASTAWFLAARPGGFE